MNTKGGYKSWSLTKSNTRGFTVALALLLLPLAAGAGGPPQVWTLPATWVSTNAAELNGTVNPNGYPTANWFEWGATTNYGKLTLVGNAESGTNNLSQSWPIGGLTPGVTYHFRLVATNSAGAAYGSDQAFTTLAPPRVWTLSASGVTSNAATLNGTINPRGYPTVACFQWGISTNYGNLTSVADMGSGTNDLPVSIPLAGLSPGLTYHFRVTATNSIGGAYGSDQALTTPGPPQVWTLSATAVASNVATLNGTVNPDGYSTVAWFQWGNTTNYGNLTPMTDMGIGTNAVPVSVFLAGLTPGVTYHFRIAATNSAGATYGSDQAFATPGPPQVWTLSATAVTLERATLNGIVNPDGYPTTAWFGWGTTTSYSNFTPVTNMGGGTSELPMAVRLAGLAPGVTYHFCVVATNSAGQAYGTDQAFTTRDHADTNTVTSLADSGAGSLRQVMADSAPGDSIVFGVTGTITLAGSELVVDKDLTIIGPGPSALAVSGYWASRILNIHSNVTAVIAGLTITNGATPDVAGIGPSEPGGGIYNCGSLWLSNCVVGGNRAGNGGRNAWGEGLAGGDGGGIWNGGTCFACRCTFSWNAAGNGGAPRYDKLSPSNGGPGGRGGAIFNSGVMALANCTISHNTAGWACGGGYGVGYGGSGGSGGDGGGIYTQVSMSLVGCEISNNGAGRGGDGGFSDFNPGNGGNGGDGGGIYGGSVLTSCTIAGNYYGGPGDALWPGLPGNWGSGGGAPGSTLNGSIVYSNSDGYNDPDAPLFVDYAHGNLRLQSNSPCINAGNNACVTTTTDLDGNPRIVSGTVDLGAYEYQGPGSLISYHWLLQYGLPTDGSADYLDTDGDGMNNWQEWRCGTCPTNALSVLRLLGMTPGSTSITLSWQSLGRVNYFLARSPDLTLPFITVATNIPGQAGTTSYADTNAAGGGPFFYRVGVQ